MLEVKNRLEKVYKTLSIGILVTFLSCMLFLSSPVNLGLAVGGFILTALLSIWKPNKYTFYTFTFSTGMLLSLGVMLVSVTTVITAMLCTVLIFTGLSVYVIKNGKDFSEWLKPLSYSLIGLIILSIINLLFLGNETLETVTSVLGVMIFSGLILTDTSHIVKGSFKNKYEAALSMHLNIVNLFLHILGVLED